MGRAEPHGRAGRQHRRCALVPQQAIRAARGHGTNRRPKHRPSKLQLEKVWCERSEFACAGDFEWDQLQEFLFPPDLLASHSRSSYPLKLLIALRLSKRTVAG